jgi:glycosyltransferase involved in cell wall biosynthesis
MKRESAFLESGAPRVVHLAGRVSEEVFSFLGPTTAALASSGAEQTLVLIDDLRYRHLLPRFDHRVELVLIAPDRSITAQWRRALRTFRRVLASGPVSAVHLHGLRASAFGAVIVNLAEGNAPVFYSLRGWRTFGLAGMMASAMLRVFRRWSVQPPARAIAAGATQADALATRGHPQTVAVVETPVPPEFFAVPRNEARHPLLISGSPYPDPRSVELFARLAVLLGGTPLRIGFNWVGAVDPGSRMRLQAANVGVFESVADAARASRLASSWLFVAPGSTRRVPATLIEALAVGLPVVAIDAAHHRELVRDSETGFLCKTEEDLLDCIARLIDSPELRANIGQTARTEAAKRFSEEHFRDALLNAYALGNTRWTEQPSLV